MTRLIAILSALLIVASLAGCVAKYRPVDAHIQSMGQDEARSRFLPLLLKHLDERRGYAFARGFHKGHYRYAGALISEDERTVIFVFEANRLPYLKWSYILLSFGDSPYILTRENTSPGAARHGTTDDGDGEFKGTFKLTVMDAIYCSGETRDMPSIEGNEVKLNMYNRAIRRSMYDLMQEHYTPTYCQGNAEEEGRPELAGVRFYFDTQKDMEEFASLFVGTFPKVRYAGSNAAP